MQKIEAVEMHFVCVMVVSRLLGSGGRFGSERSAESRVVQERLFEFGRGRGSVGVTRRRVTVVFIITSVARAREGTVMVSVMAAAAVVTFG